MSEFFDEQFMLKKFRDDMDILHSIAAVYLDNYEKQITEIEASYAAEHAKKIEIAAHALKGAAANFSENLVTNTAAIIEKSAKSNNLEKFPQLMLQLKSEAEILANGIKKSLTGSKAA